MFWVACCASAFFVAFLTLVSLYLIYLLVDMGMTRPAHVGIRVHIPSSPPSPVLLMGALRSIRSAGFVMSLVCTRVLGEFCRRNYACALLAEMRSEDNWCGDLN